MLCPVCQRPYTGQIWLDDKLQAVFVHRLIQNGHAVAMEGCALREVDIEARLERIRTIEGRLRAGPVGPC